MFDVLILLVNEDAESIFKPILSDDILDLLNIFFCMSNVKKVARRLSLESHGPDFFYSGHLLKYFL